MYSKVIGTVAGLSSAVVWSSFQNLQAKEIVDCHECRMKRLPKAHELSLYDKEEDFSVVYDEQTKLPLVTEISIIRKQIFGLASYLDGFKEQVIHVYETGVAHSQSSYDYITSEENIIPRVIAITSGGLVGLLFARKRGLFKKIIFTSVGTGLVFSAFYPDLAKEYASIGWEHTKYHTTNLLEKYGGYDAKKLTEETNERVEKIKNSFKLDSISKTFKEWFEENKEKVAKSLKNISDTSKAKEEPQEKTSKDVPS